MLTARQQKIYRLCFVYGEPIFIDAIPGIIAMLFPRLFATGLCIMHATSKALEHVAVMYIVRLFGLVMLAFAGVQYLGMRYIDEIADK